MVSNKSFYIILYYTKKGPASIYKRNTVYAIYCKGVPIPYKGGSLLRMLSGLYYLPDYIFFSMNPILNFVLVVS